MLLVRHPSAQGNAKVGVYMKVRRARHRGALAGQVITGLSASSLNATVWDLWDTRQMTSAHVVARVNAIASRVSV